jgi:succinate dehydrogenase/fumarate reductase flavoprotein subunit
VLETESVTRLRWRYLRGLPDYHAELDGGSTFGRSLEIAPLQVPQELIARIRTGPAQAGRDITVEPAEAARREREGTVARGHGLVAGLLAALYEHGGVARTDVRAERLITSNGAVVGAEAAGERFDGRVVIATGGFERDPALVQSFLGRPMTAAAGPPTNRGDGLRMGMSVGAALGNMAEAWWSPAMAVPGETIDGAQLYRSLFMDLAKPGGILVDKAGRRFLNEAANYNDLGRAMFGFDGANYAYPGVPSWLVFDAHRRAAPLGPLGATDPDPAWLERADTVEALAERIHVAPAALSATIARFNADAERGLDSDFGRGSFIFDEISGGTRQLRPVAEAPFFAVKVLAGCIGTKGGLRTDEHGRVLSASSGESLPGLYAVGNAAANLFGAGYPGGGATIGPALVFGWRAGQAAVSD